MWNSWNWGGREERGGKGRRGEGRGGEGREREERGGEERGGEERDDHGKWRDTRSGCAAHLDGGVSTGRDHPPPVRAELQTVDRLRVILWGEYCHTACSHNTPPLPRPARTNRVGDDAALPTDVPEFDSCIHGARHQYVTIAMEIQALHPSLVSTQCPNG